MPREIRKIPWLTKRKGAFHAHWYEPPGIDAKGQKTKGRTRSLSLRTANDAQAALRFAAFLTKGAGYFSAETALAGISVIDALDAYELEHVNRHVIDKTRQLIAISHLKKYFSGLALRAVDIPASRGYAAARRAGAVGGGSRDTGERAKGSDSTIKRELNVLRAAANHALKWRRITHAEMPSIEMPREPRPDEALWLTKLEVDAIYNAAQGPIKDFIAVAYFTASRRAAIEALRVEQVDLIRKRINLQPTGGIATKKRRPVVPIHPKIELICRKLVTDSENGFLFGPGVDFYNPFRAACRSVGIDDRRAHPHILRHSRATHLLMAGVSIFNVAKLLGDTIQTVGRVYGHSCPDQLASAIGGD